MNDIDKRRLIDARIKCGYMLKDRYDISNNTIFEYVDDIYDLLTDVIEQR